MSKILITGGTGFIGSHIAVELINKGNSVFLIDNLANSDIKTIDRIEEVTGTRPKFEKINLADKKEVEKFFKKNHDFDAVINFAALKAVGESVEKPVLYYENNILSLVYLLAEMNKHGIKNLIFPSSCCVYGNPDKLPVTEETPFQNQTNVYGSTKIICEQIIKDYLAIVPDIQAIIFRFFNVAGAHISGKLGELPFGKPNNLIPCITQTAIGLHDELKIFGNDFKTKDGYGVRDFIHVEDLAKAHAVGLERLLAGKNMKKIEIYNLGSGRGYSNKEIIDTFEKVNSVKIKTRVIARRAGDIDEIYANASLAEKELGWKAQKNMEDILRSAWQWEKSYRGL